MFDGDYAEGVGYAEIEHAEGVEYVDVEYAAVLLI